MTFILGVDLDGVCADFTTGFRQVVASDRGISPEDLASETSWDFLEWGLDADEFERLYRKAVLEHRIFATMPPIDGAAATLWRLSDAGIWIRVITHRLGLNWGHATAVSDTVDWLDRTGIPYRDLCFLGNKPQVEADLYVDDAVHNVEALRDQGNDVIVFDAPYNRVLEGPRATNWEELEELVMVFAARRGLPLQTQLSGLENPSLRLRSRIRPAAEET